MKAIVYDNYGPPTVLKAINIEQPQPQDHEVLVRVMATSVNRTDCAMLRAKPFIMRFTTGLFKPQKTILGTEFAGQIEAIGKNITSFRVGDRVFGFDDSGLQSHAQFIVLPENKALAVMPENISYEQAAVCIEGAHYAYNFINKVKFNSGQTFLINGATGGIGSALLQFLKYYDVHVVAVGNTKNIELLKKLGANEVIDYTKEDFTKDKNKYDFIFDAVGKSSFTKCKTLLKRRGIYISSELGWMAQNIFYALITPLLARVPGLKTRKKVIFPMPVNIPASIKFINKLILLKKYMPVIDRTYSMEEIPKAFSYVEKGLKTGNVAITINL
jgi:NADPH:quinone reductase-like Zn-dependent oxidoreductase